MEYTFQAEKARDALVAEIRGLAETQGFRRVVVGISGGKDSTVTAALCARALGAENVYGVMLPDGEQADIADSRRVCEALGIRARTVNIGKIHAALRGRQTRTARSRLKVSSPSLLTGKATSTSVPACG